MEVPQRPQSFQLALPKPASAVLSPLGAVEKVTKKDLLRENLQEKEDYTPEKDDEAAEDVFSPEEAAIESDMSVFLDAPPETSESNVEHVDSDASNVEANLQLSLLDSCSEGGSVAEGKSVEEVEEARKKSEEEEAAAKERAAHRQLLAIEELVQSERNYLRMLQVSTVTIRSNLQKLQV